MRHYYTILFGYLSREMLPLPPVMYYIGFPSFASVLSILIITGLFFHIYTLPQILHWLIFLHSACFSWLVGPFSDYNNPFFDFCLTNGPDTVANMVSSLSIGLCIPMVDDIFSITAAGSFKFLPGLPMHSQKENSEVNVILVHNI